MLEAKSLGPETSLSLSDPVLHTCGQPSIYPGSVRFLANFPPEFTRLVANDSQFQGRSDRSPGSDMRQVHLHETFFRSQARKLPSSAGMRAKGPRFMCIDRHQECHHHGQDGHRAPPRISRRLDGLGQPKQSIESPVDLPCLGGARLTQVRGVSLREPTWVVQSR